MPRDRSLEEFVTGGGGTDAADQSDVEDGADGTNEEDGADPKADDERQEPDSEVEQLEDGAEESERDPLESTYAWSADGGVCEECDTVVDARWRHDGGFVCEDCKDW